VQAEVGELDRMVLMGKVEERAKIQQETSVLRKIGEENML
jgi:hypothetical protein